MNRYVLFVVLLIVAAGCRREQSTPDWSELSEPAVAGALEVLARAESSYSSLCATGDLAGACAAALAVLDTHPSVARAGVCADSSVWVLYRSGLWCSMTSGPRGRSRLLRRPGPEPGVRSSSAGEVLASSVAIIPFLTELPGTDPHPIAEWVDTCLGGPKPATKVLVEGQVTVDAVKEVLTTGPGVLFWSGHGDLTVADTISYDLTCALMTGESYSRAESLAGVIVRKYRSSVGPATDYLRVVIMDGRYYMAIMPGFVRRHGNFDFLEGGPTNQTRSVANISCCFSTIGMKTAFLDAGVDAYCGWDWATGDSFSGEFDRALFRQLTDTALAGEAVNDVVRRMGDLSPMEWAGRQARFQMYGDSAVMVRSQMTMTRDGERRHGYSVVVAEGSAYAATCVTGPNQTSQDAAVNVTFPGVGSWNCLTEDDASIIWTDVPSGKYYFVEDGCIGVWGTVTVDRLDEKLCRGTFSGQLGYWVPPRDPSEVPPDEVINITDGFFKHSGRRYSVRAAQP